jgi:N-acetyl sugar amidotransferase
MGNMKKNYRICSRCVMDTSDVDIVFDEQGYCNHCNNYFKKIKERTYKGNESDILLQKITDRMKAKSRNRNYDCILGVSGGIDSSYAAYILKKMGMRTLLVHVDNGWNSEISESNIKALAEKLGFDYECFVVDKEEFHDLQVAFLKASVPEIETPTDIILPAALHIVAEKHKVKYIISGGNFATEGILPKTWHYNAKDYTYLKYIHKIFGSGIMKKLPRFGWRNELYYKIIKGIRFVYLLNFIDYKKDEAKHLLETELNWKYYGGKHYESIYTGFVQSYILPEKFDIDYRRATLSTQICAGEVKRHDAIQVLSAPSYEMGKVEEDKKFICIKLGISTDELHEIMKEKPRLYRDFPNAENKLELIYKVYRLLFRKPDYR